VGPSSGRPGSCRLVLGTCSFRGSQDRIIGQWALGGVKLRPHLCPIPQKPSTPNASVGIKRTMVSSWFTGGDPHKRQARRSTSQCGWRSMGRARSRKGP
jgi:hypothetical protein